MEHAAYEKLRELLTKSLEELHEMAGNYEALLKQLTVLQQALQFAAVDTKILEVTQRTFPFHLQRMRAGRPTNDGLDDTRLLLVEINRVIELHREHRPAEAEGPESTPQGSPTQTETGGSPGRKSPG